MVPHTEALCKFNSKAEDCVHCKCLLNIFSNHTNPISLRLEETFHLVCFHSQTSLFKFLIFLLLLLKNLSKTDDVSIDILDFSFNYVMESHNSSLLLHLPTFIDKMPVTPKNVTSVILSVFWSWRCVCTHMYALSQYESLQIVHV